MRWFNGKGEAWEVDITVASSLNGANQDGRVAADIYLDHIAGQHKELGLRVHKQRGSPSQSSSGQVKVNRAYPRFRPT